MDTGSSRCDSEPRHVAPSHWPPVSPPSSTAPPSGPDTASSERSHADITGAVAGKPEMYVIVHSVSKRHNVGMLLRSCTAFGVRQVVVVGRRDLNTFGSHGSADYVPLKHFLRLTQAREYLKAQGCVVCGVEIMEPAKPIQSHPFTGPTAFLLGNEGSGLSSQEASVCDQFVYIPQHGPGTASLNVVVAASIVLHHFAIWAGYGEQARSEAKFVVGERPQRQSRRNMCPEDADVVAERRREKHEGEEGAWIDNLEGSTLETGTMPLGSTLETSTMPLGSTLETSSRPLGSTLETGTMPLGSTGETISKPLG